MENQLWENCKYAEASKTFFGCMNHKIINSEEYPKYEEGGEIIAILYIEEENRKCFNKGKLREKALKPCNYCIQYEQ